MMSEQELNELQAREIKNYSELKGAELIGIIWLAYGDERYYKLEDGTYGYMYVSIGD